MLTIIATKLISKINIFWKKAIKCQKNTTSITLNSKTFAISDFSVQGIDGVGKKMIKPIEDGILDIDFNQQSTEKESVTKND